MPDRRLTSRYFRLEDLAPGRTCITDMQRLARDLLARGVAADAFAAVPLYRSMLTGKLRISQM